MQQENDSCTSFEMSFMDADRSTPAATPIDSTIFHGSNIPSDFGAYYASLNCYQGMDNRPFVPHTDGWLANGGCPQVWKNEEIMGNIEVTRMESSPDSTHACSAMHSSTTGGISFHDNQFMLADTEYSSFFPGNVLIENSASVQLPTGASYISSEGPSLHVKAERDELIMPYQYSFHSDDVKFNAGQEVKQLPGIFPSIGCQSYDFVKGEASDTIITTEKANYYEDIIDESAYKFPGNIGNLNSKSLHKSLSISQAPVATGKQYSFAMSEEEGKPVNNRSVGSKGITETSKIEDDSDVCIIEHISHPAPISRSAELGNPPNMSRSSGSGYTQPRMVGGTRPKTRDEQYILRVALQVSAFTSNHFVYSVLLILNSNWQNVNG